MTKSPSSTSNQHTGRPGPPPIPKSHSSSSLTRYDTRRPPLSRDGSSASLARYATRVPQHHRTYLTDSEIDDFINHLDHNQDGYIDYDEIERALDAVHDEIAPEAKPHNLHHDSMSDRARHAFLRAMIGSQASRLSRDEFKARVRRWKVPSMKQEQADEEEQRAYMRRMPKWRRFRSWWSVHGPKVLFIAFVVCMELAFGLWQLIKYVTQTQYRAAFGWGVVLAKTSAGFLYPTFFFLILSMSRYFSTFLRRSYSVSKYINWDLSQDFHIYMSILALVLSTLHAIGHLTGSFIFGSRRSDAVTTATGVAAPPDTYGGFVGLRPGFTGVTALTLMYTMSLLSMPQVRRWNYEVFQLAHLLMYPVIGLLMAHGTVALLQVPMMGYWLAFPTLMVLVERATRVAIGFRHIPATLTVLDDDTVEVIATIPPTRFWAYKAGQYIFLQVPKISFWQWHPFTVSECVGNDMKVNIKVGGNWTKQLKELSGGEKVARIQVGINGPFGAPAQRFYDYSHTILVGSGIGVTPFSGILRDLQTRDDAEHGGPDGPGAAGDVEKIVLHRNKSRKRSRSLSRTNTRNSDRSNRSGGHPLSRSRSRTGTALSRAASRIRGKSERDASKRLGSDGDDNGSRPRAYAVDYRRTDFHWTVRDKNHLAWFSSLLNGISRSQAWHKQNDPSPHLDIRVQTHVTQQRKSIATHVYRWLLEMHRTDEHPESSLTGLVNSTHFGRPDFVKILDAHYEDMACYMRSTGAERDKLKVGVFFCGAPVVGEILADRCRLLTAKGAGDGTGISYVFMTEVFE